MSKVQEMPARAAVDSTIARRLSCGHQGAAGDHPPTAPRFVGQGSEGLRRRLHHPQRLTSHLPLRRDLKGSPRCARWPMHNELGIATSISRPTAETYLSDEASDASSRERK